jgi:rubrerythrin
VPPRTPPDGSRREKPQGKLARFADARKNNNDLLADCERLLLREAEEPQMQNGVPRSALVIHPSEMAKSDWCPRSTYLRIKAARAGRLPEAEAHHFQLENIFEEGHEYHRKWQSRFRRMGRLYGTWFCEACTHRWLANSPTYCPECGAPDGALSYYEVQMHDAEHLIHGNADGIVLALAADADDVMLEVKSVGEGTVRQEMPKVLQKHTHEVPDPQWVGKTLKVLDHRGVWKDITKPFGPHLRQGLIYLRLWGQVYDRLGSTEMVSEITRIAFIYEYKPTSAVKAFYVTRADDLVQELWDQAADIKWALDGGGRPPRCISRDEPCKQCKPYEEQESEHDGGTAQAGRAAEGESPRRRRPRAAEPAAAEEAEDGPSRARRRPDRPRGRRADGPARDVHEVGGLLGRPARGR